MVLAIIHQSLYKEAKEFDAKVFISTLVDI
jgi:hypothetical protein